MSNIIDNFELRLRILRHLASAPISTRQEGATLEQLIKVVARSESEAGEITTLLETNYGKFVLTQSVRVGTGFETRWWITSAGYQQLLQMEEEALIKYRQAMFARFMYVLSFKWLTRK